MGSQTRTVSTLLEAVSHGLCGRVGQRSRMIGDPKPDRFHSSGVYNQRGLPDSALTEGRRWLWGSTRLPLTPGRTPALEDADRDLLQIGWLIGEEDLAKKAACCSTRWCADAEARLDEPPRDAAGFATRAVKKTGGQAKPPVPRLAKCLCGSVGQAVLPVRSSCKPVFSQLPTACSLQAHRLRTRPSGVRQLVP